MNKIILLLSLLFCAPAWAVPNIPVSKVWELAGFGGAGAFMHIAVDPDNSNTVYLVSDVSGFLKSTDAGGIWKFSQLGTTSVLNSYFVQAPSDLNTFYMLGNKITKSTDRGKTWSQISTLTNANQRTKGYKVIAVDPNNKDKVYFALSNGTIQKTTDGGASVETYATPFGANIVATFLYIDTSSRYLFVGSEGSGMKRYDLTNDTSINITLSGTNALYNAEYSAYTKNSIEYLCVGGGLHISCTSNDGATWTNTADVTATTTFFISELVARPLANGQIRYLAYARRTNTRYGTNVGVVSNDSGATWTSFWENDSPDFINNPGTIWGSFGDVGNIISMSADPANENRFWATTDGSILRSDDGGLNWAGMDKGAQNVVNSDLACSPRMATGITRCFVTSMDAGILYSDNIGDTWTPAFPNTANDAPQGFAVAGHIWRVVTRGNQAAWDAGTGSVVATTSNWADFIPRVIVSNDNGVTWTIVTSGLPTTKLETTAWSSTVAYTVGRKVRTADGVYNCILANTGNNPANGASPTYWELVRSISSIHAPAWGIGYPRALAKCPVNDNVLALGIDGYSATENGGIFISTNGGMDWTRTTQPPQWKTYNAIAFDPTDLNCNTIEFAEFFYTSPNLPKTWRTTDRGVTWASVENDIGVYDMAYASNGIAYKVGLDTNPMIDRSVDGITWESMTRLNTSSQIADGLHIDANNPNRICVGVNDGLNTGTSQGSGSDGSGDGGGSIYCTADAQNGASATWYNITGDLPSPSGITAITFVYNYLGQDWVLVGTDGAGTFRLSLKDRLRTTISNVEFQ